MLRWLEVRDGLTGVGALLADGCSRELRRVLDITSETISNGCLNFKKRLEMSSEMAR